MVELAVNYRSLLYSSDSFLALRRGYIEPHKHFIGNGWLLASLMDNDNTYFNIFNISNI